jgi:hypothetical protein
MNIPHPAQPTHVTLKIAPLLILLLFALAIGPGCIVPRGGEGTPTQAETQTPVTTLPPTPAVTIPPGPVVTVPPDYYVAIQVTRNPNTANPYIAVAFRGGAGQFILQKITATVARSDGKVIQETIPESGQGQYAVGDSVRILGTTGVDRVVVVVTILGVDYKIYDQNLNFYSFM